MSVGNKTKNLEILQENDFLVPAWIAIDSRQCSALLQSPTALETLCCSIHEQLQASRYAVRSSSLTEDQDTSSMAGQFHTELGVSPTDLGQAIRTVLEDAIQQHISLDQFSLIVQEYIPADYAGVCFTRNPIGGRAMVLEYHQGGGEALVSGTITPIRKQHYRSENTAILGHSLDIFKTIERLFEFPQDIERCVQGNTLRILQSRPITTITQDQYQQSLYLDEILPKGSFHYEKTEISEVAPRPTPFTYSLLQKIYDDQGPIAQVYAKHHISYTSKPFLQRIGNELFIDRTAEKETLLHTYNPLHGSAFIKTIKNLYYTTTLSEDPELITRLIDAIKQPLDDTQSSGQSLNNFFTVYQIIFETNLFAAKYFKVFELLIQKQPVAITQLINSLPPSIDGSELSHLQTPFDTSAYLGNTLEISDNDGFYSSGWKEVPLDSSTRSRWNTLSSWQQEIYKPAWIQAVTYSRYREYARMLMIKYRSHLRVTLHKEFTSISHQYLYFHTIEELLQSDIGIEKAQERKSTYEHFSNRTLPPSLHDTYQEQITPIQGIASGISTGVLVTRDTINSDITGQILYTPLLTPTLTTYFDSIQGIITRRGGLLSHLAIIAREQGIPIVLHDYDYTIDLGKTVTIDGSRGTYTIT